MLTRAAVTPDFVGAIMENTRVVWLLAGLACAGSWPSHGQTPAGARFDLVGSRRDANGLLLNPSWGDSAALPPTLDPVDQCGILAEHGTPGYRQMLLRDTACFSALQRRILRLNEPRTLRLGGVLCGQPAEDGSVHGHVNWFPVTLTGILRYAGSLRGTGGDYDLTFELVSAANWPVTRWNSASTGKDQDSILRSIHLEFDYRETTNRLPAGQGAWWRLLDSLALGEIADTSSITRVDSLLGPGRAIVTGLFNLDAVHQGHSELHPVYAIAILVAEDTSAARDVIKQRWALMARDRGNEGNCATGVVPLRLGAVNDTVYEYRFVIESPGGDSSVPRIDRAVSWVGATGAVLGPVLHWAPRHGLEVAVRWPRPRPDNPAALMLGVLDVSWSGRFGAAPSPQQLSFMGLQRETYKGRSAGEIVRAARRRARSALVPPGEANDVAAGKAKPGRADVGVFQQSYYARVSATGVNQVKDWERVTRVDSLRPADSLPPAAAEIFDVLPTVVGCDQVRDTLNPRCVGDWSISPQFGLRLRDPARDGRRLVILASLGLEGPKLDRLVGNVHFRPAVAYAQRRRVEDTAQVRTQHRWSVQVGAALGPWMWSRGFYAVVNPELGWDYDGQGRGPSPAMSFGLGTRPRNGYQVDFAVEVLYWVSHGRGPYLAVALKIPIVAF